MSPIRKTMISIRLLPTMLKRVDYAARNPSNPATATRTAVIAAAIEAWLPGEEAALKRLLGTDIKRK